MTIRERTGESNVIGNPDTKAEKSKMIFEVELTEDEANALENFLKHLTSNDFQIRAKDSYETYIMANAIQKVRKAIADEKNARH